MPFFVLLFATFDRLCVLRGSEVELRADLEEPGRRDLKRIEVRRPVRQLVLFRRIRVEQVEDIEVDQRLRAGVSQNLAESEIDGLETLTVQLTRLNDVQDHERLSAGKSAREARLREEPWDLQRYCLPGETLSGHRGELVPRCRQAAERPADQDVDSRHGV